MISIVVPIYNSSPFLQKCLDSIMAQTYTQFEVILIDDGSTDNSRSICEAYQDNDTRVVIHSKPNAGVSSARNLGLKYSRGEFVCFVDSDDVIAPTYLEHLLMSNTKLSEKGLVFHRYINNSLSIHNDRFSETLLEGRDIVFSFNELNLMKYSGPYAKLFNLDVIRKYSLEFPIGIHMGEDFYFLLSYLSKVNQVLISDVCDYEVIQHPGSLSQCFHAFKIEWIGYCIIKSAMIAFIKDNDNTSKQTQLWSHVISILIRCMQCDFRNNLNESNASIINHLESIPQFDYELLRNNYFPVQFRRKLNKYLLTNHHYLSYCHITRIFHLLVKLIQFAKKTIIARAVHPILQQSVSHHI